MSIKVYNEVTGEWEVRATNQAELVEIEDVTGELDTEDVEGALTTLVDKLEDVEVKLYEAEKQLDRIDKKATAVIDEFSYHLENHPSGGGGGGDWVLPTITSTFEDNTVVDENVIVSNLYKSVDVYSNEEYSDFNNNIYNYDLLQSANQ